MDVTVQQATYVRTMHRRNEDVREVPSADNAVEEALQAMRNGGIATASVEVGTQNYVVIDGERLSGEIKYGHKNLFGYESVRALSDPENDPRDANLVEAYQEMGYHFGVITADGDFRPVGRDDKVYDFHTGKLVFALNKKGKPVQQRTLTVS